MQTLGRLYCWFSRFFSYLQSPLLLIFRLVWGFWFFQTGWAKFSVKGIAAVADSFAGLGIPLPFFNAFLVAGVETIGGLLLIVGFLSRFAAFPLTITMITAYATAHRAAVEKLFENPQLFLEQAPWNFLVASLLVLAFGPGAFSIDYFWQKCCGKESC